MNIATDQIDIDLDEEKKTAEDYLIHYDFYREQLKARREEIIDGRPMRDNIPKKDKHSHGNPTYTKTAKLLNKRLTDTANWLKAVEATREHFARTDSNHGIFIAERYDMGMTPRQIAADIGVSKRMVYFIRDEVLERLLVTYYKNFAR